MLRINLKTRCGTDECIEVMITPNNKNAFKNRYIKDDNGNFVNNEEPLDKYIGKIIEVRSPIHCKSKNGICRTCLGNLFYGSTEAKELGIFAAQSLGELSTQLVLRTFHFSGSATIKADKDRIDKNKDISNDLEAVQKIFSNTYDFDSEFNYMTVIDELFEIYQRNRKSMRHVIIEIIVGELLYSGDTQYRLNEKNSDYEILTLNKAIGKNNPIVAIAFEDFNKNLYNIVKNKNLDKDNILYKIIVGNLSKENINEENDN